MLVPPKPCVEVWDGIHRDPLASRLQGQGLGGQLLLAAARRCLRVAQEVGGTVLLIDAKDERAATWYASYGAMPLLDTPHTLVLSLDLVAAAFKASGKLL